MRLGRLHLRLASRRRDEAMARFDADACWSCLGHLARALAGLQWMVVSGLVEPLIRGAFSRGHSDVDIAVPLSHLGKLQSAALDAGYVMTTRLMRSKIAPGRDLELHLHLEPGDVLLARRPRRLRLWRLDARGELDEAQFPPYVDVFPFVADGGELRILDGDWRLPLRAPIVREARLPDGQAVPVEDPYYLQALHALRSGTQC